MPYRPAMLRGQKVLARCDERGVLQAEGGRVEIRYKATDTKLYRAALGNLQPLDGALLADDAVAAAAPVDSGGSAKTGGGASKGGSRGKSAAAATPSKPVPAGALVAYTDGACTGNPGPAGLGVVMIDGPKRRELSRYLGRATNNIAELTAIEEALLAVEDRERTFVIHTDSQYSIGVLSKGWKPKVNQELIARIKTLLSKHARVDLRYVKGHAGIADNERADELARAAVLAQASSGWVTPR